MNGWNLEALFSGLAKLAKNNVAEYFTGKLNSFTGFINFLKTLGAPSADIEKVSSVAAAVRASTPTILDSAEQLVTKAALEAAAKASDVTVAPPGNPAAPAGTRPVQMRTGVAQ